MNILITRPLIDSEDLMGKLFSLGHKIIHVPTLKISKAELDPIDSEKYNAFIFTSANAIRSLKLLKPDRNKLCFCVGAITEKIVRQQGYYNTISAGGTINALKNIIVNSKLNDSNEHVQINGSFNVIPTDFLIKLPSFMLAEIKDLLNIKFDLYFKK